MRAVVTGGAGYIGSHLVRELHAIGFEVDVIDNLSRGQDWIASRTTRIRHHGIDISDEKNVDLLASIFQGVDNVFHLAASRETADGLANVRGTYNVLDAARAAGVKKVIFTSSCEVYGDTHAIPTNEADVLEPRTQFAFEKMMSEELCLLYSRMYGLGTITLRLYDVYGPDVKHPFINDLLNSKKNGNTLKICGDGLITRDFIHVDDVINALILAWRSEYNSGNIFNIGSGEEMTMNEIAKLIDKDNIEHIDSVDVPERSCADIEAAVEMLQWKPQKSIKNELPHIVAEHTS